MYVGGNYGPILIFIYKVIAPWQNMKRKNILLISYQFSCGIFTVVSHIFCFFPKEWEKQMWLPFIRIISIKEGWVLVIGDNTWCIFQWLLWFSTCSPFFHDISHQRCSKKPRENARLRRYLKLFHFSLFSKTRIERWNQDFW